jgi:hypothetical protein
MSDDKKEVKKKIKFKLLQAAAEGKKIDPKKAKDKAEENKSGFFKRDYRKY